MRCNFAQNGNLNTLYIRYSNKKNNIFSVKYIDVCLFQLHDLQFKILQKNITYNNFIVNIITHLGTTNMKEITVYNYNNNNAI